MVMDGFKSFGKRTEFLFGNQFNCVLGPNGSGKSARADTEVLLSSGEIIPIGEIVERSLKKATIHCKLDDGMYTPENPYAYQTWGLEPKTMKVVSKNISAFIKRDGEPYLFTIKTRSGREVTTTGCHPVMVFKDGEVKSEIVDNLKAADFISTPNYLDFPDIEIKVNLQGILHGNYITKELARLLGYLVGDGCISPKNNRIELVNQDRELYEDFVHLLEFFGLDPKLYHEKRATWRVYAHSNIFINSLIKLFKENYKKEAKHIPSKILFSKKECLANFLAALFDCDGSVRKNLPTFEYVTMSKKLADHVLLALLRFGIVGRKVVKMKEATNTKKKIKKPYFEISIEGKEKLLKLYKSIPLRCKNKKSRLKYWAKRKIKSNPNTDVLPTEVNTLLKKCIETLRIPYKPLRKKNPFLAAYMENRCCPTRIGIKKSISILNYKISKFNEAKKQLKKSQKTLMKIIRDLNLSRVDAAKYIGVTTHAVTDFWDKGKSKIKNQNLEKLYNFVKNEIETRSTLAYQYIETLHNLSKSDIFWDPIVEIKKVKGEKYVYDLTIPNCHNFIGNGIFVHNSNVLDALSFVLGKSSSKSLRAEKSANLIYNGGKAKKPAKHGEVSIYFDNSTKVFPTADETVKITRIIKKDGASKYKINDESRTRQQILDLLNYAKINPDSYNIIMQGDIVKMVEMTPMERRQVIEEIAGISVYEEKKNKALKEMEKVDLKVGEADIVLKERKTYLRELKSDRDQAMKFKDLNDKIRQNQASYLKIQIDKNTSDKKRIEDEMNKLRSSIESSTESINKIKTDIEDKKTNLQEIKVEIEEKGETEQINLQKELDTLRTNIATNKTHISSLNNELVKISQRKDQLQNNLGDIDEKIESFSSEKKELEERKNAFLSDQKEIDNKIASFKEKHKLDEADESIENMIEEIDRDSESKQQEIQELREKQQSLLREKDKNEFEIKTIDEKIKKVNEIEKEHKQELDELKSKKEKFKATTKDLNLKLDEITSLSTKLIEAEKKSHALREEVSKLKARDIGFKETLFANLAVKKILESKGKFGTIHGTVSELGNVPKKFAAALEVAAGARMNSIVTDSDEVAAKCIAYLKTNKLGRASFLPLNKLKDHPISASSKRLASNSGVEGLAIDLISFDAKYKKVFSYVFQDTLVVKDITTAQKVGIGSARMVTLDGDLTELSGAMHGGFRSKRTSSFKDNSVSKDIESKSEELKEYESRFGLFSKQKVKIENEITSLRELKAELEGDIIKTEKGLHLDSSDLDASKAYKEELIEANKQIEKDTESANESIIEVNKGLAQIKVKKQELRDKISQLKKPTLIAELNTFEQQRNEIREEIIKVDGEIKSIDTRSDEIFGRDKSNTVKIISEIDKEEVEFKEEITTLKQKVETQSSSLKEKEKSQEDFNTKFRNLFNTRSEITESMGKNENEIELIQERTRDKEKKSNLLSLDIAKVKSILAGLREEFAQYEGVTLNLKRSEADLKAEINQTERLKEKMGNVNMRALEIYETVEKEYTSLLEKKDTLMSEKEDITKMMDEIEGKKKELFMKTFTGINDNFKKIFSTLSNKGEAYLEVEDLENPFEAGLLFNVRLTGNKFMDIRSLSGGEKTLTALAFIFSIQEHDPASFYVLDEVDAALDKNNSEKFAKLIRNYADKAQYIIISHNDQVISEAETLYGVSMNEHGQSKVVSLKI